MVQRALDMIWSVFGTWDTLLHRLFWVSVWLAVGLGLVWLFNRAKFDEYWPRVRQMLSPLALWGGVLLIFGVSFKLLGMLGQVVEYRVMSNQSTSTTRGADPEAAPTTQQAPRVTYLKQKDYERTLVIPPAMIKRVKEEGVQILAPYLTDPTAENIMSLRDRFWRNGQDIMFTRTATLMTEEPLRLDKTLINLNLNFVSPMQGAQRSYYDAAFAAQYAFTNPLTTPITARFVLPLPAGSGTLSDFQVIVNGQELSAEELVNGSGWQGELNPQETVNVAVNYRHQGARGWTYVLGERREPIRNFALTVKTNQNVKFNRYSLYPTRQARTLTGTNLSWDLKNVITAQDVSLSFNSASLRETLQSLYAFTPFALQLGALFGLLWTFWRKLNVTAVQVGLGLASILIGTFLGGMLMNYLPVYLAGVAGALVGSALAVRAMGREYWPPVLLATLLPLAFLSLNHAGLLIALAGVVVIAALIWNRPGSTPPRSRRMVLEKRPVTP